MIVHTISDYGPYVIYDELKLPSGWGSWSKAKAGRERPGAHDLTRTATSRLSSRGERG